jgi:hypothetical protein
LKVGLLVIAMYTGLSPGQCLYFGNWLVGWCLEFNFVMFSVTNALLNHCCYSVFFDEVLLKFRIIVINMRLELGV